MLEYQPSKRLRHPSGMRPRAISLASILSILIFSTTICTILFLATACNTNPSPDQIRRDTAQETATLKQDTKAVAEGIKEGLTNKKPLDLNKATREDLTGLPGIDARRADRIIAERPYTDKYQVVTRGALSNEQYEKIQDLIAVPH